MKPILFILLTFISGSLCAQTNSDYTLLKIYRGAGSNQDSVKVKVYNQEPFNVAPTTMVIFKIYSKGGYVITATNGANVNGINGWYDYTSNHSGPSWFLQFEPGKVICMLASPGGGKNMLKEIKESAFNSKTKNANPNVIELEEDMNKPIKKTQKHSD